jgi:hypothetical protein
MTQTKSKARVKQSGEVFTPPELINQMLDKLPITVWSDASKTFLEPSAGDGNFLIALKERLLAAGHSEKNILDNMLFSIELIPDNHWTLQHRLGYLIDGKPNPKLWKNDVSKYFTISEAHPLGLQLSNTQPYHEKLNLQPSQIYHHINHICYNALEYDMSFGRQSENSLLLY